MPNFKFATVTKVAESRKESLLILILFKRLRATAGQGPNYVGPFCGILGLCWPILKAMWVHLGAMLAYLESYVGRS